MYDRSYYEKNKEYIREYQRQYYYKQKLKKQNEEVVKKNKRKYETEEIENFKRIYQKMIVEPVLES